VDIAAKLSDQVALVKNGAVIGYGPPEETLQGAAVASLYDFSEAIFDQHLGGIELKGHCGRGKVFVAAGLGSGALIYRLLAKRGFSIATGIVPTNDLDCYVARSLGADCVVQNPLEPVNGQAMREALVCLERCDTIIDAGFEVGEMNRSNVELLKAALKQGKTVFTLRKDGLGELTEGGTDRLVVCADPVRLLDQLENHLDHRPTDTAREAL
jgi:iron complex transport system ATP-binding protein